MCVCTVQFAWLNFAIVYSSRVFVIRHVLFRTEYLFLDLPFSKATIFCVHCWARGCGSEYFCIEEAYSCGHRHTYCTVYAENSKRWKTRNRINRKKNNYYSGKYCRVCANIRCLSHVELCQRLCHHNWNLWPPARCKCKEIHINKTETVFPNCK